MDGPKPANTSDSTSSPALIAAAIESTGPDGLYHCNSFAEYTSGMAQDPVPQIVPPGAGVVGASAGEGMPSVEVKLGAEANFGFSVVEYHVPVGFSPPPLLHRQTREDAVVYILEGELRYWFAEGDAVAGPGTLVRLPRGGWNRWANEAGRPCRLLAIFAPAGFEQYFLELAAAMAASGGDRAALGETIGRLREHYGDEELS